VSLSLDLSLTEKGRWSLSLDLDRSLSRLDEYCERRVVGSLSRKEGRVVVSLRGNEVEADRTLVVLFTCLWARAYVATSREYAAQESSGRTGLEGRVGLWKDGASSPMSTAVACRYLS